MILYECDRCHKRVPGKVVGDVRDGDAYFDVHVAPPDGWVCAHSKKTVIVACSVACYKRAVELAPAEERKLLSRIVER